MADFNLGVAELGTQVNLSGLGSGLSDAETLTKNKLEAAANGGLSMFQSVFVVGLGNVIATGISALTGSISGMFQPENQ